MNLRAPRWTLSSGATFHHSDGLFANINASYRAAYYQDTVDQAYRDIAARALVNAKIGWQGGLANDRGPIMAAVHFTRHQA